MNRQFIQLYDAELTHLRHMAGEFAERNRAIASRLNLTRDGICDDPHVERLLEGFAFMAARVQLKLQAEFPRFTQGLLETIQPHYLSPTPSMTIVRFEPFMNDPGLTEGPPVPRGTLLRSMPCNEEQTECTFQTAHDLRLWPLEIESARYLTRELGSLDLPADAGAKAAIRLRLRTPPGVPFRSLSMETLPIYIKELGRDNIAARLYENIFRFKCGVFLQSPAKPIKRFGRLSGNHIQPTGFSDEQSLLPYGPRSFQGYRLLREYFVFPQRFSFIELIGLGDAISGCPDQELDLVIALREGDEELENRVDAGHFSLFCTPAINLFPMELDRIWVTDRFNEFHVVPDAIHPLDYEVFEIESVTGYGLRSEELQQFEPFYLAGDRPGSSGAYYSTNRVPRTFTTEEVERGRISSYSGCEVYLSLVDGQAPPYSRDLRQLGIRALCTNRHLPIRMPRGSGLTDFRMDLGVPCKVVRCVNRPTDPRSSPVEGEMTWRMISHLSLNYLSLTGENGSGRASDAKALRDLLRLYADLLEIDGQSEIERRISGLQGIETLPVIRRVNSPGPVAFARGMQLTLSFDEAPFEGFGVYLLGSVLDQFLRRYVSINSFVETIIKTNQRGEIMRWPGQAGNRHIL